jgi:glutaconate CoA-transferase subunit A
MTSGKKGTGPLFVDPNVEKARAFFASKKPVLKSKLMTARQAVELFVHDGDYLASGGFGTNRIPSILLHEIVRQGKKNLGLAGHTMTHDFQILCAGECVSRCDSAYILGLEARGLSPNARRLIQEGKIELCEWTNAALAWRFRAAAMGISFIPSRVMLGTDTFEHSAAIEVDCPFTGQKYAALPALYPDVAIIHVHRADPTGNCQIDGLEVADVELSQASKHVLISAEEIVSEDSIRSDPGRTKIPATIVDAVIEAPYGSYPGNMPGLYFSDEEHIQQWLEVEKDPAAFKAFLQKHIYGVKDFYEYLDLCGGIRRIMELSREERMLPALGIKGEGAQA